MLAVSSLYMSLAVNPLIVTNPMSQLAIDGVTVNFSCTAIAFPYPMYNWTTPITGRNFNTNTISFMVDYSYYGNYTCTAESIGATATSQAAVLTGL